MNSPASSQRTAQEGSPAPSAIQLHQAPFRGSARTLQDEVQAAGGVRVRAVCDALQVALHAARCAQQADLHLGHGDAF